MSAEKKLTEREKLEAELAAAEAENAAILAARAEREEIEALRRKLEEAANVKRDAPHIEAAEAKHGAIGKEIAVVDTSLGAVVVKRPAPMIYKRFQDRGEMKTQFLEELVRPCVVYPTVEALNAILDEQPGALIHLANACAGLADRKRREQSGKS